MTVPSDGDLDVDRADVAADAATGTEPDEFDRKASRLHDVPAAASDMNPAAVGARDVEEEPGALPHDGLTDEEAAVVEGAVEGSDVAAERDEYLEALRRVKAEFDNYKKRTDKERLQMVDRASESLVGELLPVLDACEAAVAHGDEGVAQVYALLCELLAKRGLELMDPVGAPFDPEFHEAVLREDGDGDPDHVVEVMRSGYTWRGRVVRPAMVKVRS